jgi:hypothetical protein
MTPAIIHKMLKGFIYIWPGAQDQLRPILSTRYNIAPALNGPINCEPTSGYVKENVLHRVPLFGLTGDCHVVHDHFLS